MTSDEVIGFLETKSWTPADQLKLVDVWNETRTDANPITLSSVRTPCRLRQVVGSLRKFVLSNP